jgi:imidazoleglycerol-phosphate dehydratase
VSPAGARRVEVERATAETQVRVALDPEGQGRAEVSTGVGFLDHMLAAWARHALCDLSVRAAGDLAVDPHHTVEDVGIVLGQAVHRCLGDRAGIRRYGWALLPMDDALAQVALDFSGRPYLGWDVPLPAAVLGGFPSDLAPEFWRAWAMSAAATLHVRLLAGVNAHHALEAVWKGAGLACRQAWEADGRIAGPLSTKGSLVAPATPPVPGAGGGRGGRRGPADGRRRRSPGTGGGAMA